MQRLIFFFSGTKSIDFFLIENTNWFVTDKFDNCWWYLVSRNIAWCQKTLYYILVAIFQNAEKHFFSFVQSMPNMRLALRRFREVKKYYDSFTIVAESLAGNCTSSLLVNVAVVCSWVDKTPDNCRLQRIMIKQILASRFAGDPRYESRNSFDIAPSYFLSI